jgi:hypothetical protein
VPLHDGGVSPPAVLHPLRGLDAALRGGAGRLVPTHTLKGACTGLSIADATPLAVCHNLRIQRHSVFKGVAQRGKSSTGWFYGFKLHAVINHRGELLAIKLTPANVDDRKGLLAIASNLFGKLYADKGYIGKEFAQKMKDKGVDIVTRVRKT